MELINILYYESSSGFGGSSSNLYHILRQLDKSRYRPIVVVHKDGDQFERIKSLGITVIKVPYPQLEKVNQSSNIQLLWLTFTAVLPMIVKLRKIIKDHQIGLIHINTNILLSIPMIFAAELENKKIFCYIRESRPLIKRERVLVSKIHQFFILNHQAYDIYKQDIPEEKLHVVYDGVDLEEFKNLNADPFLEEFQLKGSKVVGLVGRIIEGKGQLEFAQTAQKVLMSHPDAKFVIVGDAKDDHIVYFEKVKKFVKTEGLEKSIIFTGWRKDVKQIMQGLNVLVLASTTFPEGLPNAIIEAMALKKPAVATDIPGPPEIIEDKVTGFIVAPGDTDAMAQRISELLSDEVKSQQMGQLGRKRAEKLFDVKKVVKKAQELYEAELAR